MDINDIRRMTSKELVERVDALVKSDTVKGEMDDDTVLWQLLKIELEHRLIESDTFRAMAECTKVLDDFFKKPKG